MPDRQRYTTFNVELNENRQPRKGITNILTAKRVGIILLGILVVLVVVANTGNEGTTYSSNLVQANTRTYKPVFLMHGLGETQDSMSNIVQWIGENHPNTIVHTIPRFEGLPDSATNLWEQIGGVWDFIESTIDGNAAYDDGYHLVCHSLGGMVCRGIVQTVDGHNVDQFITLATPHVGIYGCSAELFGTLGGSFTCSDLPNLHNDLTTDAARESSQAEVWHDPNYETQFLNRNVFLPVINNLDGAKNTDRSPVGTSKYKDNLAQLGALVAFSSSADTVITPWQSERFGYLDDQGQIQDYTEREEYQDDTFGLRSLDEAGGMVIVEVDDVDHYDWINIEDVFVGEVLDYLT